MPTNMRVDEGLPLNTNANADGSTENLVVDAGDGAHYSLSTTQLLALSATAQASSAIGTSGYKQIRVVGTSAFHLTTGATPVATSASPYFPAGVPEVINIPGGQKASVIQDAASGTVYITQLSYP